MELVEYEYLELTKGGSGGGSKYKLRELAEDEALRWYSESRKIRSPVGESEDRKSPTSGKSRRGKIRSSYRDNYNSRNKEIKQMIDDERGPHPDRDRDFSFFKQESDIFYESEIRELVSRIPDPVMIWTNQTGKSGMGAAPIQVIVELVQRYGLEIYAAGIVIGKNESRNERISLRFCERIMSRLKSQSTPKYDKRIPKSGNGLGSALPDDL